MSIKKKITAFSLLAIFLLGTIGITTYNHFCSVEGNSISLFIPAQHTCEEEVMMAEMATHDCCQPSKSQEAQKKDNCCKDVVKSYKVHDQYNHDVTPTQLSFHLIAFALYQVFPLFLNRSQKEKQPLQTVNPNLSPQGLSKLRQLQVWRL